MDVDFGGMTWGQKRQAQRGPHVGLAGASAPRTGYPLLGCVPAVPNAVSPISMTSFYLRFAAFFGVAAYTSR